jgi:hypothetical protein
MLPSRGCHGRGNRRAKDRIQSIDRRLPHLSQLRRGPTEKLSRTDTAPSPNSRPGDLIVDLLLVGDRLS